MHEIRAVLPPECVSEAAGLAHNAGIERVTVSEVMVHGPNVRQNLVSVETSTPKAKAFVDALLASPALASVDYTLTSRELRAILSSEPVSEVTRPMVEPFPDVIQDLWQLSHVTSSYLGRAAGGGILLANGVIEDSPIAIVVAALFLPFLSQVLAVSFGLWSRDRRLLRHGLVTLSISAGIALAAGALVALITGGPIRFSDFKSPLSSFLISSVIGTAAGLSSADDAGRRYLIGVAAAVQLAVFPVWLGASIVLGLPPSAILASRLYSFLINLATISGAAALAFAALHLKGGKTAYPPSHR
jgi:Domain of unknown function (DUF389)